MHSPPRISERSRLAAALLAFFLGWLGAHRFYVGKVGTGILMIITVGGFGIWATIDLILILVGAFTDIDGRPVRQWMDESQPRAAHGVRLSTPSTRRSPQSQSEGEPSVGSAGRSMRRSRAGLCVACR